MIASDRYECLGEFLFDALTQYKSETALLEYDRKVEKESLSYADVRNAAMRVAARLQNAEVGAGDRVAIVMSNQSKWLIAALGAFYRGAVVVPIDYKLTGEEQERLLAHAKPRVLVTEYAEWRDLTAVRKGSLSVDLVLVSDCPTKEELPARHERFETTLDQPLAMQPTLVKRKRSDQATLVYSSGTGGDPKGCVLTHDNYLEQYRTLTKLYPFEVGDRYFSVLPTNHAIDFMVGFVGAFACGATVVHQRTLRPEFLRYILQEKSITHMAVVPLILEAFERRIDEVLEEKGAFAEQLVYGLQQLNGTLTAAKPLPWLSKRLLRPVHKALGPKLKMLFVGGAFVDARRAQRFYDLGVPVVIGYGLTEACTVLTLCDLKPFRADSVGKPLEGVDIEIRQPNAEGIGDVWVRSRTVFAGYLDLPEETAEVLQDGWLRTGDLGLLDASGQLHLVGRSKNMIVTAGGKNIYPEDIEHAFGDLEYEDFVVYATGYVWPTASNSGEGLTSEKLFAVVRPKKGKSIDASWMSELNRRNQKLADFKRLGAVLVWDDEMPRTASMKVKRPVLAETLRCRASVNELQVLEA